MNTQPRSPDMCDPTTCARDCVPRVTPGTDPRLARLCVCDPDADRLAALMGEGYDQRTASLMLWAPDVLGERGAA